MIFIVSGGSFLLGFSILWTTIVVFWTDTVSNSWSSFPSETARFFWNVFFLRFYVSFPMVSSMNPDNFVELFSAVSCLFCFKFFDLLISRFSEDLVLFFSLGSAFAFGEVEDFRLKSYYILFLDTFCFDFFVFVGGRKLFRSCMSAFHGLNFFLFENPYRPLQYSLSGSFSEDWFPEGSLFAWTLKYFNCKGIFIDFFSSL